MWKDVGSFYLRVSLAIIIATLLVLSGVNVSWQPGFNLPSVSTTSHKVYADSPVELTASRTESSKTFYLGNNRYALDSYIGAIHYKANYKDEKSPWLDIDTAIVDGKVTKAPYDLSVYLTGEPGFRIISKISGTYDIRLKEARVSDIIATKITPDSKVVPKVEGNKVTWKEYYPGVDVVLTADNNGVHFDRIIREVISPKEYDVVIAEVEKGTLKVLPIKPAIDAIGQSILMEEKPTVDGRTETLKLQVISLNAQLISYPITDAIDVVVGVGTDDGYISPGEALFDNTGNHLQAGVWGDTNQMHLFVRFTDITMSGTINSSNLTGYCESFGGAPLLKIYGVDESSPSSAPTSIAEFEADPLTSANVDWDTIVATGWVESPSINTIIQELLNSYTYSGNSSIMFQIKHDGTTGDNSASFPSYEIYGTEYSFRLHIEFTEGGASVPTVVTGVTNGTASTSANVSGNVTITGGASITSWGTQYGILTSYGSNVTNTGSQASAFGWTDNISGLSPSTLYHYRIFAINSAGNGYGSDGNFTTPAGISTPIVSTNVTTSIEETTATANGTITATGGENASEIYFQYDTDSGIPYANNQTIVGSYSTGNITFNLIGLSTGATYYGRAGAKNTGGTGWGNEVSWLMKPLEPTSFTTTPGDEQIQLNWAKGTGSTNTTITAKIGSYPTDRTDGTVIYNNTGTSYLHSSLTNGNHWYYRAWGVSINSTTTQYSDTYGEANATPVSVPTVVSTSSSLVEETTASCTGNITDFGGDTVTAVGAEYGTASGIYTANVSNAYTATPFTANLTGLTKGDKYFWRTFATSSNGTGYGGELTFITKPDPASSFVSTGNATTSITFSWLMGTGGNWYEIRYLVGTTPPTDNTTGTLGYAGSADTTNVTGLSSNTTYSFRLDTYAIEGGLISRADGTVTCQDKTDAAANPTIIGILELVPSYQCISVYANFSGSDNVSNNATLEWRTIGGTWKQGMALTVDRRADIFDGYWGVISNDWANQFRGSVIGLTANTEYEVRVTFTDPNGITGTSPVTGTVTTKNDIFSLGSGTIYYVSSINGSDAYAGTISHPWLTVQHAVSTVVAGDTIYLRAGTFTEGEIVVTTSGTASNYITLMNYNDESVTIDFDEAVNGFDFQTAEYWRVHGLTMQNTDPTKVSYSSCILFRRESFNNVVEYCNFLDFGYAGDQGVGVTTGSGNITVQYCYFNSERNTYPDDKHRSSGVAVYHSGDGEWPQTAGEGMIVRYNEITGTGIADLFSGDINNSIADGARKDTDIYGNYIHGICDDGFEAEGAGINVRIWGNTVVNSYVGVGLHVCVIGPLYIFRNVFIEMGGEGGEVFKVGADESEPYDGTVYIYHNSAYTSIYWSGGLADGGGNKWQNHNLRNNIIYTLAYTLYITPQSALSTNNNSYDYDCLYQPWLGIGSHLTSWNGTIYETIAAFQAISGQELHGQGGYLTGDPLYVNPASNNLSLQLGSPCIDAGVALIGFNDANSPWPANGLPDIGAYEYEGITAPVVTTQAATLVEETTATLNGNVTETGSENVSRGVEYDTDLSAPYSTNWTDAGTHGIGAYTDDLTGLNKGDKYATRAWAANSAGTGYGSVIYFMTKPDGATSFVSTGNTTTQITCSWTNGTGMGYVEIRGLSGLSAPSDNTSGTLYYWGSGTSATLSGLSSTTNYTFRLFTHALEDSTWSDSDTNPTFTDLTDTGVVAPTVTTQAASLVEETTVTLNGTVDSTGGENVTRGFELDTDLTLPFSTNWTDTGTHGIGAYTDNETGLNKGDKYATRAWVANSAGTEYGDIAYLMTKPDGATSFVSTGNGTSWVFCTWTNGTGMDLVEIRGAVGLVPPTDNTSGTLYYWGNGTSANLTGLAPGTTYTFRIFTHALEDSTYSNSDTNPSVTDLTDILIVVPTVTTQAATLVEETSATLNGNVTSTGGENCSIGFEWDSDLAAPFASNWTSAPLSYGTGAFSQAVAVFNRGDKYAGRASANNTAGYSYGAVVYWMTKPDSAATFASPSHNNTWAYFTWNNGVGMTHATIRYLPGAVAPTNNVSGTLGFAGFFPTATANITGLTAGTQYTFRIFTNALEDGTWSTADGSITLTVTTSGTAPVTPTTTPDSSGALGVARVIIPIVMVGIVILALVMLATSGEILMVVLGAGIIIIFLLALLTAINQILG